MANGQAQPIRFLRRDIDLTQAQTNAEIVPPGNNVNSFWVAAMPGGLTASLRFGQKPPIPIVSGLNIEFDECTAENEGIFLTTSPALPAQTLSIIFGVGIAVGG